MTNGAVATFNTAAQLQAVPAFEISREQIELIKRTVMPQANDLELDLFLNLCRSKRLDPLTKQIYAIKTERSGWQFFASIDGLRVIAQRSGEYLGQTAPFWCGPDGEWKDVWLADDPPAAAKIGVWKRGNTEPTWGVATFREYGKGKKAPIWLSMPSMMLSKCSEAIALRKAFPDDLSGVYVREEFQDGDLSPQQQRSPASRIDVDEETGEIIDVDPVSRITRAQAEEIVTIKKSMGWAPEYVRTLSNQTVGKEDAGQLTEDEAKALIEAMRAEMDKELQAGLAS